VEQRESIEFIRHREADLVSKDPMMAVRDFMVFEMDRQRRRLHDPWDVFWGDDAKLTDELLSTVSNGELQPYAGATLG
jgi:hypothetical protein